LRRKGEKEKRRKIPTDLQKEEERASKEKWYIRICLY